MLKASLSIAFLCYVYNFGYDHVLADHGSKRRYSAVAQARLSARQRGFASPRGVGGARTLVEEGTPASREEATSTTSSVGGGRGGGRGVGQWLRRRGCRAAASSADRGGSGDEVGWRLQLRRRGQLEAPAAATSSGTASGGRHGWESRLGGGGGWGSRTRDREVGCGWESRVGRDERNPKDRGLGRLGWTSGPYS